VSDVPTTGMHAGETGIIWAGCDCDSPRAYGRTMDVAKEKAAGAPPP